MIDPFSGAAHPFLSPLAAAAILRPGHPREEQRGMGLAVAIQMDPMETINFDGDSTFVLALEAQARGHALYHYLPQHLALRDGRLRARGRRLEVRRERGRHHTFGAFETLELQAMDVILMRQD